VCTYSNKTGHDLCVFITAGDLEVQCSGYALFIPTGLFVYVKARGAECIGEGKPHGAEVRWKGNVSQPTELEQSK
jgi:hypothetical protein